MRSAAGEEETGIFSLTDNARAHLQLYVDNLNRITGANIWAVGEVVESDNIVIEYNSKNCLAAINELAEKTGTEWWGEGYTLNLSRCEHGEPLTLGYGNGLLNLSKDRNGKTPFFTRLYPIGSTRNIDRERYGHQRLQLPDGIRFVEKNTQFGIFELSEADAFSGIYPRRIGYVSSVRSEEVTGDDGNPFTIYYFKDKTVLIIVL